MYTENSLEWYELKIERPIINYIVIKLPKNVAVHRFKAYLYLSMNWNWHYNCSISNICIWQDTDTDIEICLFYSLFSLTYSLSVCLSVCVCLSLSLSLSQMIYFFLLCNVNVPINDLFLLLSSCIVSIHFHYVPLISFFCACLWSPSTTVTNFTYFY